MPNYDYECPDCGHVFEHFQSMNSEALKECPQCHKNSLYKIISGGLGVILGEENFTAHHDKLKRMKNKD